MHKAFENIVCNLCGSSQSAVLYPATLPQDLSIEITKRFAPADHVSGNDRIVRCQDCGLMYASPRLKTEYVWQGYADAIDEKYATQGEGRMATFERAIKMIETYLPQKGRMLDVGSAAGFFLKVAQDSGWKAQGIEPNKALGRFGSRKYGVPISDQDFLKSNLPAKSFDVVTFWDVLEHVGDPRAFISEASRVLKPGGILVINYPDMDSIFSRVFKQKWWFVSPVHLFYFNKRTLGQYIEEAGFEFIKQQRYWQTLALEYLFVRFADYSKFISVMGVKILSLIGLKNLPMRYWAGQSIFIAKKI